MDKTKDAIVEIDELCSFIGSKKRMWVWIAVERNSGKILGFEVGVKSELTCDKLYKKLASYKIKLFCTDNREAYKIVMPKDKHIISKAETSYI